MQTIRAAERALGYVPQQQITVRVLPAVDLGGGVARLVGRIVLFMLIVSFSLGVIGVLIQVVASLFSDGQIQPQFEQRRNSPAVLFPPPPASTVSIEQLPLPTVMPRPLMPEIEPQAETEAKSQTEAELAGSPGQLVTTPEAPAQIAIEAQPQSEPLAEEQPESVPGAEMQRTETQAYVAGAWEGNYTAPEGQVPFEADFRQKGLKLTGVVRVFREDYGTLLADIAGVIEGNNIRFVLRYRYPNWSKVSVVGQATAGGTRAGGTWSSGPNSGQWQMQRQSQVTGDLPQPTIRRNKVRSFFHGLAKGIGWVLEDINEVVVSDPWPSRRQ